MKTKEEIKHDFKQNHYRKQRELIDAGELDYWGLSEENRRGIVNQCKEEAEKYPKSKWELTTSSSDDYPWFDIRPVDRITFGNTLIYYRRIDPLPTEDKSEEVAELTGTIKMLEKELAEQKRLTKVNADASSDRLNGLLAHKEVNRKFKGTIKMLEKDLKEREKRLCSTLDDLRKEKQLRSKVEKDAERLSKEKYAIQEFVDAAAEDVERYKGEVIKFEKKLSQQKNVAELASEAANNRLTWLTEREEEVLELKGDLAALREELTDMKRDRVNLLEDIRTLALKLA